MKKNNKILGLALALLTGLAVSCSNGNDISNPVLHEHTFAESLTYDDTHHWYAATCGHSDEVKDKVEHTLNKREVITASTETSAGMEEVSCSVCGVNKTRAIPAAPAGFVGLGNYIIAKTELTYAKWYEVYQWAINNGYVFQDLGREGCKGIDGAVPSENSKQPVTNITFRDAIVWCNAASEKDGLSPVYEKWGSVIKTAERFNGRGTNTENTADTFWGLADTADVREEADGYRLPSLVEWEYAAKGGENFIYSGSDDIDEVAWYSHYNRDGETQDVGTKKPNSYGLYDMTGNLAEMCWDSCGSDGARVNLGGSWERLAKNCVLPAEGAVYPWSNNVCIGIRLVRNAR